MHRTLLLLSYLLGEKFLELKTRKSVPGKHRKACLSGGHHVFLKIHLFRSCKLFWMLFHGITYAVACTVK